MSKTHMSIGEAIARVFIHSIIFILLGLIYFIVTLWIIKTGSALLNYNPGADWAVLSAAIISCGTMIGSAIKH